MYSMHFLVVDSYIYSQEAKITRAEDVRVVFKELTRKHDTISCCIHLDNEKFPSRCSTMKNRSSALGWGFCKSFKVFAISFLFVPSKSIVKKGMWLA